MSHDDHNDAGESLLAGIDLDAWRVPPPSTVHRASLLVRALAPATAARARRPRLAWLVAAIVLVNALIATLLVILLARPVTERTVVLAPAGGPSVDPHVRDVLKRLEQEQRDLEQKLAEIRELRALVIELSEKVRLYEEGDARCERTVERQRDRPAPAPQPHRIDPLPLDPYDAPLTGLSCDEVGCVLGNYAGACCDKYRSPGPAPKIANALPDALDRMAISNGIASIKPFVASCGDTFKLAGLVRVRVQVDASGKVTSVTVDRTPDAQLGVCVAAAVQRAVFPKTKLGGSFSYPFVF